jgi:hypothetical protein
MRERPNYSKRNSIANSDDPRPGQCDCIRGICTACQKESSSTAVVVLDRLLPLTICRSWATPMSSAWTEAIATGLMPSSAWKNNLPPSVSFSLALVDGGFDRIASVTRRVNLPGYLSCFCQSLDRVLRRVVLLRNKYFAGPSERVGNSSRQSGRARW